MKKKGFTLVELLAVIAILAILVIIALPNVMKMFRDAKKNSFTTEIKEVFKSAEQQWMMDSMTETYDALYYSRVSGSACTGTKLLDLSGRKEVDFFVAINKSGKVTKFYASDGTYDYEYDGGDLQVENIDKTNGGTVKTVGEESYNGKALTCDSSAEIKVKWE